MNVTLNAINSSITSNNTIQAKNLTLNGKTGVNVTKVLNVSGTLQLSGGTGAVVANNTANNISGAISVSNGSSVTINNTVNTTLGGMNVSGNATVITSSGNISSNGGAVTAGNLTLTGAVGVTVNGTVNVTGATQLSGGTGDVVLSGTGNNLAGAISVSNGSSATINNSIKAVLGAVNVSGNATVTTGGNITSNGSAVTAGNLTLTGATGVTVNGTVNVTGTTQLSGGSGAVVLNSTSNKLAGAIGIGNGTSVSINNSVNTTLGAVNVSGAATVNTSSGNISSTGGAVTAGNLTLTGAAGVAVNGTVNVTGTTQLSGGTGAIVLKNAANNLSSTISINNASTVSLNNSVNTLLGAVNASGDVSVTSKQNLTLNGNIVSGGNVTLTAGNGVPINADQTNGNVTGGDVIKGTARSVSAGTGKTVTIYSGNANSNTLASLVGYGTTSQKKVYNTSAGGGTVNTDYALNLFYRVAPTATITGSTITQTYNGTTVLANNSLVSLDGVIDGDGDTFSYSPTLVASASGPALVGGGARNAGNYTIDVSSFSTTPFTQLGYTLTKTNGLITIAKADITAVTNITANNKTYDGNTTATLLTSSAGFTGKVDGDVLTVVNATGAFANKNVADGKSVNITGLALGGADAGNYNLTCTTASATANIAKANLTIAANNFSRTYDGTTSISNATVSNLSGSPLFSGDTINANGAVYAFTDKNVGAGNKTVTLGNVTINDGNGGNNYKLTFADNTTSTITAANLTVGLSTGYTKTYDGTISANGARANVTNLSGTVFGTDAINANAANLSYSDKNVGTGKAITISGVVIDDGNGGANYNLTQQTNLNSSITRANLTVAAKNVTKTYDGTTTVTGGDVQIVSGTKYDSLITDGAVYAFTNKNAGSNKAVTLSNVTINDGNNYNLTLADNTTSTITAANLTVGLASGYTKTYDGTTSASGASVTALNGTVVFSGDAINVSVASIVFTNENAGSGKGIDISGVVIDDGNEGRNYNLTQQANTNSTITRANLIVAAKNVTKTYDGLMTATGAGVDIVSGTNYDTLITDGAVYAFTDKNADVGKTVTVSGVTINDGNNGNNYKLTLADNTTSTITAANLTVGLSTGYTKTYDGTTSANGARANVTNLSGTVFSGDTIVANAANLSYSDKNVGTGKAITISGVVIDDGNGGANYNLTQQVNLNSSITRANLTVGLAAGFSKIYDGTTSADGARARVTNLSSTLFGGDAINVNAATFTDKNAGQANKTVTFSGVTISDDNGGANYNLTVQTNTNSTITKANITAITGITAANKVYDSTQLATLNTSAAVLAGEVNGDDLIVVSAKGVFVDKNVGVKSVALSDFVLGGTDVGNYQLQANSSSAEATITPATISAVTGITANNKTYDGLPLATLNLTAASYTGKFFGDALSIANARGAFVDKNVGSNKSVAISGLTLGGTDAGNYRLGNTTASTTAAINPANISAVTGIKATSKVYDATLIAGIDTIGASFSGAISGDRLSVSGSGVFADKNVGSNKSVAISGLTLGGADAGNYLLQNTTASAVANITKANLTIGTGGVDKLYDGTTWAPDIGTIITGLRGEDSVSGVELAYTTPNVGKGKAIKLQAAKVNDGNNGGNYALVHVDAVNSMILPANSINEQSLGADFAPILMSSASQIHYSLASLPRVEWQVFVLDEESFVGEEELQWQDVNRPIRESVLPEDEAVFKQVRREDPT